MAIYRISTNVDGDSYNWTDRRNVATRKATFCLATSPGSSCKLISDDSYSEEYTRSVSFLSTDHGLVQSQSAQGENCYN